MNYKEFDKALRSADVTVAELKAIAKTIGTVEYSTMKRADLTAVLYGWACLPSAMKLSHWSGKESHLDFLSACNAIFEKGLAYLCTDKPVFDEIEKAHSMIAYS